MSEHQNQGSEGKTYDPFKPWREMRDAAMDAWAKSMMQAVNTEAYAQATGTMLDAYLTAMAPFREIVEKTVTRALEQSNFPTRSDVIAIAERLTNIEMRLDDLDAKLDSMIERANSASGERHPKTRAAEGR